MSEKKTQLATVGGGSLANVDFGEHAGRGKQNMTSEDVAIPFLNLLQAGSPQVTDGEGKYIMGAKAGDLVNSVTNQLLGKEVYVVPCLTEHCFIEWVPRDKGGGFVARHELSSDIVAQAKRTSADRRKLKTPDGNDLVETYYLYALMLDGPDGKESVSPIVIGFCSSKIKVYKGMNTALMSIKGNPPLYAFRLAISSVSDKSKDGKPFKNFVITPAAGDSFIGVCNLPTNEFGGLLAEGKKFVESIEGGIAKVAHETQDGASTATGDNDEVF